MYVYMAFKVVHRQINFIWNFLPQASFQTSFIFSGLLIPNFCFDLQHKENKVTSIKNLREIMNFICDCAQPDIPFERRQVVAETIVDDCFLELISADPSSVPGKQQFPPVILIKRF